MRYRCTTKDPFLVPAEREREREREKEREREREHPFVEIQL